MFCFCFFQRLKFHFWDLCLQQEFRLAVEDRDRWHHTGRGRTGGPGKENVPDVANVVDFNYERKEVK